MQVSMNLGNIKGRYVARLFNDSLVITISDDYDLLAEVRISSEKLELRRYSGNSLPGDPDQEINLKSYPVE